MESQQQQVVTKTSSKKGKDLFKRCAERQANEESLEVSTTSIFTSQSSETSTTSLLPGVDFEVRIKTLENVAILHIYFFQEIEDEFEKLHREMMKESDNI